MECPLSKVKDYKAFRNVKITKKSQRRNKLKKSSSKNKIIA